MAVSAPQFIAPFLTDGAGDGKAFVSSVAGLAVGATVIAQARSQPDKVGIIASIAGSIVSVIGLGTDAKALDISAYRALDGGQLLQPAQTVAATQSSGVGDLAVAGAETVAGALTASGGVKVSGSRIQGAKGADVASAGTLTLGADGNLFAITGTTNIDFITTTGWQAGSEVTLRFGGSLTLNHNTGSVPASTAPLFLAAAGNVSATANDMIKLIYTGAVWAQIAGILAV